MFWGIIIGIVVGWMLAGVVMGLVAWLLGSRLVRREAPMREWKGRREPQVCPICDLVDVSHLHSDDDVMASCKPTARPAQRDIIRRKVPMLARIALASELREVLDARQECPGGAVWRR